MKKYFSHLKPDNFIVGLFVFCFVLTLSCFAFAFDEKVELTQQELLEKKKESMKNLVKNVVDNVENKKETKQDKVYIKIKKLVNSKGDYQEDKTQNGWVRLINKYLNDMSDEQREQFQKDLAKIIESKDEIVKEFKKLFNDEIPKQKDEIREKLFGSIKSEKSLKEEKFISKYTKHRFLMSKFVSCSSNVDDGVLSALVHIVPVRSLSPLAKYKNLEFKLNNIENIKNYEFHTLLPFDDGYFYNPTYGILLFNAKDKMKNINLDVTASYKACSINNDAICDDYKDDFKLSIKGYDKDGFKLSDCYNINEIISSIPDKKYSLIKVKDIKFDKISSTLEIKVDFVRSPVNPYAYYYDEELGKNIYAVVDKVDNIVNFKLPYEDINKHNKLVIKDKDRGLIYDLKDIKEVNNNKKAYYYLARALEKGFFINFFSPSLLLLVGFFISFCGYGQGKTENVRKRAKEILVAIFLVFVLFGIFLMFSYKIFPDIRYGVQFLYPYINVIIISLLLILFFKIKENYFTKALLIIPLFIFSPFTGVEEIFNNIYFLGPVFCLSFALVLGVGFSLPYILFLIIPEYVVVLSGIDSVIYKYKNIKWLPLILLYLWYVFSCLVSVFSLNKMVGEPFTIEKLDLSISDDKTVFVSMDNNYNLLNNISRIAVLNAPSFGKKDKTVVLRINYHDLKNNKYLKTLGIKRSDQSLLFGRNAKGGLLIDDFVYAGNVLWYIRKIR